jgi:archaellum component FlaF (FlaF/FlaG flagellin family)
MGFSVTIASFIVLIGFLALFTPLANTFFMGFKELSYAANDYNSRETAQNNVRLRLIVDAVNATSCNATVENIGSKTIFFKSSDGFNWNTIILSYGNSSQWQSYMIEEYEILEVKVSGTNTTFNPSTHCFVNSGEEVRVSVSIPSGAPEISAQAVVSVTFASYYGATASGEAVMA